MAASVAVAGWLYHRTVFAFCGKMLGFNVHVPSLDAAARSAAQSESRRRVEASGIRGWLWRLHYDWLDWNGLDKSAKLG